MPYRGAAPGWKHGLLVRRSIPRPDERAYYVTHAPNATTLPELVRGAGARWTVEASFEAAKGEVVRGWTAWRRHVTLAMRAHAYLAGVRAHAAEAPNAAAGGENRPGARRRAAAAHRPGGAASPLAPRVGRRPGTRGGARLVAVAAYASAARLPLPLAAANARR